MTEAAGGLLDSRMSSLERCCEHLHDHGAAMYNKIGVQRVGLFSIKQMMKSFAWLANRNSKAKSLMAGDRFVQFEIEGQQPCYLHFSRIGISFHDGRHDRPDVILRIKPETILKMLKGEIGQQEAFALKKIEVTGSMVDAMRFNQVTQAVLKSTGIVGKIFMTLA